MRLYAVDGDGIVVRVFALPCRACGTSDPPVRFESGDPWRGVELDARACGALVEDGAALECPACAQPLVEEVDGTFCGGCGVEWHGAALRRARAERGA